MWINPPEKAVKNQTVDPDQKPAQMFLTVPVKKLHRFPSYELKWDRSEKPLEIPECMAEFRSKFDGSSAASTLLCCHDSERFLTIRN